ncbi:exosome complex component MTR3 [Patella vulgata]|uniref:exosome complex component MTR3 n=1 Tax=Patella vulgata TaxID=6465 RepID=UPI00217FA65C|nr:exosome complex component MTR3 [Patella vulgata]
MPVDSRRICGPESTQSPVIFTVNKDIKQDILLNGERKNGRKLDQIRPLFLRPGLISQAKGSAYIEQNHTKVICAVFGPREVMRKEDFSMKGQLTCEFKFATFSCKKKRQHQQDAEEKDLSVQLLEAFEPAVQLDKFPKAQVNVYITVLQNDGSALAASITCASLALADAGIEMYDIVVGSSVRIHGDVMLVDPSEEEEYRSQDCNDVNEGNVVVGLMPSINQISALTSKGEIDFETISQAIKTCIQTCQKVYPVLQNALVNSVKAKT